MSKHIFSDTDIKYIIEQHFISKRTTNDISREFSVSGKVIHRIIEQNDFRTPVNWGHTWCYGVFALKCAIALYNHGIGLRGVCERLDIPIVKLTAEFKRQGVKIRTQSEQESIKWSLMSDTQRANQVRSCHIATKDIIPSEETLEKTAKTRENTLNIRTSDYETDIIARLPFDNIIRQKAIGAYNIDFTIGNIAVEINGGNFHRFGAHADRHAKRSKKIFDSGFSIIFIYVDKNTSISYVSNELIRLVNELSIDKTSVGKYWVIWSTLKHISTGCFESIDRALILPTRNERNRITGRYHSTAK